RQGLDRDAAPRREGVRPGPHSVPGHARRHRPQLPRGARVPRPPRRRARRPADRGQRARGTGQRPGPGVARRYAQPDPDPGTSRRGREVPLRRAVRRRPPRRGEGTRQGAGVQLPRRLRPVGPAQPAARAVVALQRAHRPGRVDPGVPAVQLDRARRVALHRAGAPGPAGHLLRARARGGRPRRHALRGERVSAGPQRRVALRRDGPLPHGGGRVVHGGGALGRRHDRQGDRRGRRDPHHRARRDPRRRQGQRGGDGRPQAGRVLLMSVEAAPRQMDLLRFATAGSVDDGKSTLIGRLLYDSKAIFEDQLEAVEATSRSRGDEYTNLALLTDGLRAEREQGITIDVAYRYFATPRRKFIIADTPGHIQYTRNMVTGSSTADLALILVDARKGLVEQSRRHAFLCSLLRVPHLVLCVNKMDLVDWSQEVFERIADEFTAFAARLDVPDLTVVPISALKGDNIAARSENMPWYEGPALLHYLEHVYIASDRNLIDMRFPVQYVIRPMSHD